MYVYFMVSYKSISNFFVVNMLLTTVGFVQYQVIHKLSPMYLWTVSIFMMFIARNYVLMWFIGNGTKHKPCIQKQIPLKEAYKHEFHLNVVSATAVETLTYACIRMFLFDTYSVISLRDILVFIPLSFVFEVVFDFFHYWSHRLVHQGLLYRMTHKKHHKYRNPVTIITYYQDPIDLLLTNSIPTLLALMLLPVVTLFQYHLLLVYKEFIEISGHSGKRLRPTSSFSQCIWLPRFFDIQLYTEDHDLHHSANNCNYSKRFNLWDKMFGTYSQENTKHNM
jgi:sterol desaturase/sphingolipid hydroxylase (fatty acid hydroxylase superfamily)